MRILENRGRWYKGNLHMHTTISDGVLTPEEAVERYRRAGYDFIALTDHRQENPEWQDDDFLVLTGAEYDTGSETKPFAKTVVVSSADGHIKK